MFLVSGFESTVFGVGEGSSTSASSILEKRGAVGEGGADFAAYVRWGDAVGRRRGSRYGTWRSVSWVVHYE